METPNPQMGAKEKKAYLRTRFTKPRQREEQTRGIVKVDFTTRKDDFTTRKVDFITRKVDFKHGKLPPQHGKLIP
jgi:hypothetical protein